MIITNSQTDYVYGDNLMESKRTIYILGIPIYTRNIYVKNRLHSTQTE